MFRTKLSPETCWTNWNY